MRKKVPEGAYKKKEGVDAAKRSAAKRSAARKI